MAIPTQPFAVENFLKANPQVKREINESLEQLRWLNYGHNIQCGVIKENLISINTKKDVEKSNKK